MIPTIPAAAATDGGLSYTVIEVDTDGSAQLQCATVASAARARGFGVAPALEAMALQSVGVAAISDAFWCRPDLPVRKGQSVRGTAEFSPHLSMEKRRMPTFTVTG